MAQKIFIHRNQGPKNDYNAGIIRSEMYFCRTAAVPLPEYRALLAGFQRIIDETDRQVSIRDYGNFNLGNVPYGSPEWYQDQALTRRDRGFGRQVSARVIDSLLREEPFQKQNPHFDVMVVDRDLTTTRDDPQNNFIFGYGPYPNNIISVRRFIDWIRDPNLREACLSIMGAHEFGHNMDLVYRDFNIGTERYTAGHCDGERGPCLMEQVNIPGARDIDEQARLLIDRDSLLCPDCSDEIQFKRDDLRGRGIYW